MEKKDETHNHHADCGHVALTHIGDNDLKIHVGFLVDGELECFLPNFHQNGEENQHKTMKNQLDCCADNFIENNNVNSLGNNDSCCSKIKNDGGGCCKSSTASASVVLSSAIEGTSSSSINNNNRGLTKRCKVPLPPVRECCETKPCEKHIISSCVGHDHGPLLTIKHSDHVDYLVLDNNGNYVLHHMIEGDSCVDHGVLFKVHTATTNHNSDGDNLNIPLLHHDDKDKDIRGVKNALVNETDDEEYDESFEALGRHWLGSLFVASISDQYMPWMSELASWKPSLNSVGSKSAHIHSHSHEDYGHSHEQPHDNHPEKGKSVIAESFISQSTGTDIESNSKMSSVKIHIAGMCCTAEIPMVERVLLESVGVQKQNGISINLIMRDVIVKYDPLLCSPQQLVDSLNAARLDASLKAVPVVRNLNLLQPNETTNTGEATVKKKSFLSTIPPWNVILGLILWLLSFLSFVEDPPEMENFKWLSVIACIICIPKILLKCIASLKRKILDVNCLMIIAVIGALALQDFEEAGSVVVIFSFSNWLEDRATSKARESLEKIIEMKPEFAIVQLSETQQNLVPVDDVNIDDICIIRAGDKVPVDGIIINGHGLIDESNLTGESVPVEKKVNDNVQAGTINAGNSLLSIRATAKSENSAIARLVKLVQESQSQRSPTEQIVERVAAIYTPIVVFVALLLATIPFAWGTEIGLEYVHISLTLLVVACPCAFVISTPITYVCGIAAAAKNGIVVKGGKYLESAAQVEILAMDKTGTLTKGVFGIIGFHLIDIPPMIVNSEIRSNVENITSKKEFALYVAKICCKKEANMIMNILQEIPEVLSVSIHVKSKRVTVAIDNSKIDISLVQNALEKGGLTSTIVSDATKVDESDIGRDELLEIVKACEENSTHPLANALRQLAEKEISENSSSISVKELVILPGEGVQCELLDGRIVYVGNSRVLNRLPTSIPKMAETLNSNLELENIKISFPEAILWGSIQETSLGATVGWVIVGNKVRAIFAAADTIRPEAFNALKLIKQLNIDLVMLTGDNAGSANRVANSFTTENGTMFSGVHSSLKPEEKVQWVKKLENRDEAKQSQFSCCSNGNKKVVVAMIGDGVNDSPSLAAANVSIAMGAAGSPVAIETADIALMDSDLGKIGWFFKLSRDTRWKIFQNISFSIIVKLITIILSVLGYVGLGVAIGIDVGCMLIVTLNGVDLLRTHPKSPSNNAVIAIQSNTLNMNDISSA